MVAAPVTTPLAAEAPLATGHALWVPPGYWVQRHTGMLLRGPTRVRQASHLPIYLYTILAGLTGCATAALLTLCASPHHHAPRHVTHFLCYSLPATHFLLPTSCYPLPATHFLCYPLPATHFLLLTYCVPRTCCATYLLCHSLAVLRASY